MGKQILKIGDRVEILSTINKGKIGKVCSLSQLGSSIVSVSFKNWGRGHSCGMSAETMFSGWHYSTDQLELTNKPLTDFKEF